MKNGGDMGDSEKLNSVEREVSSEDYVAVQSDSARCVDERRDKEGENLGWQAPGAGLHIVDLMRVAIAKVDGEVEEGRLWDMVQTVFDSETARSNNIVAGVHIDDEHGHLDMGQCDHRNKGCGYDGVRNQVLERMGVEISDYETGDHINEARKREWGVQVLTGDHLPNATAAVNKMKGKTLQTKVLLEEDRVPSFNYDVWVVSELKGEMTTALRDKGFDEAAAELEKNAESWGTKMYTDTLDILTQGRLGSHNVKEITE